MNYFIRKFKFNPNINGVYFQNPTKFLELDLTEQEKNTLKDYLTVSQLINHKMLTNIKTGDFYPTKLLGSTDNPLEGYVVVGFADMYDYIVNNDMHQELLALIEQVCRIFNWEYYGQHIVDIDEISSFEQAQKLWLQGFVFDSASDQSCQKMACL